jgi:hypothetical protein
MKELMFIAVGMLLGAVMVKQSRDAKERALDLVRAQAQQSS